jgi:hypothetical protein
VATRAETETQKTRTQLATAMTDLSSSGDNIGSYDQHSQSTPVDSVSSKSDCQVTHPSVPNPDQVLDARETALKYFQTLNREEFMAKLEALQRWAARLALEEGSLSLVPLFL